MKELILLIINVEQYHSAPTQKNLAAILDFCPHRESNPVPLARYQNKQELALNCDVTRCAG